MAKFTTTMTVWHSGQAHLAGEGISLTASEAEPLLASGAIVPVARAEKAVPLPTLPTLPTLPQLPTLPGAPPELAPQDPPADPPAA